ncbi:MAG: hypothetical protein AB7O95_20920 [Geminicoccaceae bacterium]
MTIYLRIPPWVIREYSFDRGYGFSFTEDGLHLNWNKRTRVLWYPWNWEHHKTWFMRPGGTRWRELGRGEYDGPPEPMKERHPYHYLRHNGEVQEAIATVYGTESEYRVRCMPWLPWPRKMFRNIEVRFDRELGEGTGSWKGGVLGTGHTWKPGERMVDALRRMERERIFSR